MPESLQRLHGLQQTTIRLGVEKHGSYLAVWAAADNDPIKQYIFAIIADQGQQAKPLLVWNFECEC